eukprot:TRINITY_DN3875_c0_g1_i1.p1 TRINITY_DN3875_c0_g1~~TRINITY_DN3875_c0_g1_i1.p1  ORF type:complete len:474 (+),score=62.92 TRINITY_DN3875_c0_g1_i1:73-1422(+)
MCSSSGVPLTCQGPVSVTTAARLPLLRMLVLRRYSIQTETLFDLVSWFLRFPCCVRVASRLFASQLRHLTSVVCSASPCMVPSVLNAHVSPANNTVTDGEDIVIECNCGFHLNSTGRLRCSLGAFDRPLPICVGNTSFAALGSLVVGGTADAVSGSIVLDRNGTFGYVLTSSVPIITKIDLTRWFSPSTISGAGVAGVLCGAIDRTGTVLYAAGLGNRIMRHVIGSTEPERMLNLPTEAGFVVAVLAPTTGHFLYAAAHASGVAAVVRLVDTNGTATSVDTYPFSASLMFAAVLDSTSTFAYVAVGSTMNGCSVMKLDLGAWLVVGSFAVDLETIASLAIDDASEYLYVAGAVLGKNLVLQVSLKTGVSTGSLQFGGAHSLALHSSQAGSFLYVTGSRNVWQVCVPSFTPVRDLVLLTSGQLLSSSFDPRSATMYSLQQAPPVVFKSSA